MADAADSKRGVEAVCRSGRRAADEKGEPAGGGESANAWLPGFSGRNRNATGEHIYYGRSEVSCFSKVAGVQWQPLGSAGTVAAVLGEHAPPSCPAREKDAAEGTGAAKPWQRLPFPLLCASLFANQLTHSDHVQPPFERPKKENKHGLWAGSQKAITVCYNVDFISLVFMKSELKWKS